MYQTQGYVTLGSRTVSFALDGSVTLLNKELDRDISSNSVQRAGQHGAWFGSTFYGELSINLEFLVSSVSQYTRDQALNNLISMFPMGSSFSTLAFYREGYDGLATTRSALVRRSGAPSVTHMNHAASRLEITVASPDAWLYGPEVVASFYEEAASAPAVWGATLPILMTSNPTGGTVTVTPSGSAAPKVVIDIYGPRTTPGVRNVTTGEQIMVSNRELVAGDVMRVDLSNRLVTLNGIAIAADITSRWFEVQPYTSTELQLTGVSSTSAGGRLTYQDAYEVV